MDLSSQKRAFARNEISEGKEKRRSENHHKTANRMASTRTRNRTKKSTSRGKKNVQEQLLLNIKNVDQIH